MKMKIFGIIASTTLIAPLALAEQRVVINGTTYICQNECIINISGNNISVRDSLGGRIQIIYPGSGGSEEK